jgi:hypothetical protein
MKIDLNEGSIDAYNFKLTSNNILLDSSATANPYFMIKDDQNIPLI